MDDQDDVACGQSLQSCYDPLDLIGKAFAAGGTTACGRSPEVVVGGTEFACDVGVPTTGPGAEILLGESGVMDWIEAEGTRRLDRTLRRAAIDSGVTGQARAQR